MKSGVFLIVGRLVQHATTTGTSKRYDKGRPMTNRIEAQLPV